MEIVSVFCVKSFRLFILRVCDSRHVYLQDHRVIWLLLTLPAGFDWNTCTFILICRYTASKLFVDGVRETLPPLSQGRRVYVSLLISLMACTSENIVHVVNLVVVHTALDRGERSVLYRSRYSSGTGVRGRKARYHGTSWTDFEGFINNSTARLDESRMPTTVAPGICR